MSWRPPCVVIWAGSRRRVGIDWGSCRSPAAVLAPEDAVVWLWQRRRRVLNTLVVVLCMFRWVFWKERPGYAATLAEGWAQRGRWGRMEEGTG